MSLLDYAADDISRKILSGYDSAFVNQRKITFQGNLTDDKRSFALATLDHPLWGELSVKIIYDYSKDNFQTISRFLAAELMGIDLEYKVIQNKILDNITRHPWRTKLEFDVDDYHIFWQKSLWNHTASIKSRRSGHCLDESGGVYNKETKKKVLYNLTLQAGMAIGVDFLLNP